MEKVKLPREVAEAIEKAKKEYEITSEMLVRDHCSTNRFQKSTDETLRTIGTIDLNTLIKALYIGFEVEMTPEDKVRDLYEHSTDKFYRLGIIDTLSAQNIKIPGVNDND